MWVATEDCTDYNYIDTACRAATIQNNSHNSIIKSKKSLGQIVFASMLCLTHGSVVLSHHPKKTPASHSYLRLKIEMQ